jgi:hypothetical protein
LSTKAFKKNNNDDRKNYVVKSKIIFRLITAPYIL